MSSVRRPEKFLLEERAHQCVGVRIRWLLSLRMPEDTDGTMVGIRISFDDAILRERKRYERRCGFLRSEPFGVQRIHGELSRIEHFDEMLIREQDIIRWCSTLREERISCNGE